MIIFNSILTLLKKYYINCNNNYFLFKYLIDFKEDTLQFLEHVLYLYSLSNFKVNRASLDIHFFVDPPYVVYNYSILSEQNLLTF